MRRQSSIAARDMGGASRPAGCGKCRTRAAVTPIPTDRSGTVARSGGSHRRQRGPMDQRDSAEGQPRAQPNSSLCPRPLDCFELRQGRLLPLEYPGPGRMGHSLAERPSRGVRVCVHSLSHAGRPMVTLWEAVSPCMELALLQPARPGGSLCSPLALVLPLEPMPQLRKWLDRSSSTRREPSDPPAEGDALCCCSQPKPRSSATFDGCCREIAAPVPRGRGAL